MKRVTQVLSVILFSFMLVTAANAQQTIAFVETESIIPNMPDYKAAQSELEAYGKQLQKQLELKDTEMKTYYSETMQKVQAGTMTPVQQKEAEKKLTKMQDDLQKGALDADQKLAKKEADLTAPLYEKYNNALEAVAKANGYTYILDKKLILQANGGIDATAKVKAELGL